MIYSKIENALIFLSPRQTKKKVFKFFKKKKIFQSIPVFLFLGTLIVLEWEASLILNIFLNQALNMSYMLLMYVNSQINSLITNFLGKKKVDFPDLVPSIIFFSEVYYN